MIDLHETTTFYSAKGGQGCTVTAAIFALQLSREMPVNLLGHDGAELAGALGLPGDLARPATPRYGLFAWTLDAANRAMDDDNMPNTITTVRDVGQTWRQDRDVLPEGRRFLVLRNCYLALRAALLAPRPEMVVLIKERGRAIDECTVADSLHVKVITIDWSETVARAVDGGLLVGGTRFRQHDNIPAPASLFPQDR